MRSNEYDDYDELLAESRAFNPVAVTLTVTASDGEVTTLNVAAAVVRCRHVEPQRRADDHVSLGSPPVFEVRVLTSEGVTLQRGIDGAARTGVAVHARRAIR